MKICLVTVPTVVLIVVALTTYTCSGETVGVIEQNDKFNSVVPYDPGVTNTNVAIGPRLPKYGQIAAGDQPDHLSEEATTKLEPQPPTLLSKVEQNNPDNYQDDNKTALSDISLEQDENSGNNVLVNTGNDFGNTNNNQNTVDTKNENEKAIKHENNHYFNDGKFVFAGETSDKSFKEDIEAYDDETENNLASGENSDNNNNSTVVEVIIEEDKKETSKEKEPKRSARYRKFQIENEDSPNAKYAGPYSGYTAYPTSPSPGFPGYPMPGYPMVTYSYPIYPLPPVPPIPGLLHPGYDDWYPTFPGSPKPPTYPTPEPETPTRYPETVYPIPIGGHVAKPSIHDYPGYYPSYSASGYSPNRYPVGPNGPYSVHGRFPNRPGSSRVPVPHRVPVVTSRRPTTSLPQRAVSAITDALKSIAIFDDQQCVPRLLCEVAGGRAASSPTLMKAMASLQPLLTILQAYNDVNTTSPLFLFGRAAVLGVTSKGNPAICRYAYPNCPNDPEKLVNYLNNHNGGFFRFFGQPDSVQQQQNLEQFYNHLSGATQNGYKKPGISGYRNSNAGKSPDSELKKTNPGTSDSRYKSNSGEIPDSDSSQSDYAPSVFRGHSSYKNIKESEGTSEPRIQNKPIVNIKSSEDDSKFVKRKGRGGTKWLFPDEVTNKYEKTDVVTDRIRSGKKMRFPEETVDRPGIVDYNIRNENPQYYTNDFLNDDNVVSTPANLDDYEYDYKHNFYVKKPRVLDDGKTVYIVRGNGDPNHPEVVKIKPAQAALK